MEGHSAVFDVRTSRSASDVKKLTLERVQLTDIHVPKTSQTGFIDVQNPDAVEIVMNHVLVQNVTSPSSRMAKTNTFREVRLSSNAVIGDGHSGFLSFPPSSVTSVIAVDFRRMHGTALYVDGGKMTIENSKFVDNTHGSINGTIIVRQSELVITKSVFKHNAYFSGSCIAADATGVSIKDSIFLYNKAQCGGGCLRISNLRNLTITGSRFFGNRANTNSSIGIDAMHCRGGAIDIHSSDRDAASFVSIDKSLFTRNSAIRSGGGISFNGYEDNLMANVSIRDTEFAHNTLEEEGSGASVSFSRLRQSSVLIRNCTFFKNDARWTSGPYLEEGENNTMTIDNCLFKENMGTQFPSSRALIVFLGYSVGMQEIAFVPSTLTVTDCLFIGSSTAEESLQQINRKGVRVYAAAASTVVISRCSFRRFWSRGMGAAVFVDGLRNFSMWETNLTQNTADEGGAVLLRSVNVRGTIQNCIFAKNSAKTGGALKSDTKTRMRNCQFYSNEADEEGGAVVVVGDEARFFTVKSSVFEGNKARIGGALYTTTRSHVSVVKSEFVGNEAFLYGGAIAIKRMQMPAWGFDVKLVHSRIRNNTAAIGGNHRWLLPCEHRDAGGIYIAKDDRDAFVNVTSIVVEGNRAKRAGGGIYMDTLKVAKFDDLFLNASIATNQSITIIKDNAVDLGYGLQVATSSEDFYIRLHFVNGTVTEPLSTDYALDPWTSGDKFPVVEVVMLDAFGDKKSLTKTSDEEERSLEDRLGCYGNYVRAMMKSEKSTFISNTLTTDVSTGSGSLDVGRPFNEPGDYSVTISVEGIMKNMTIDVKVRACRINEETALNGTYCDECDGEHYNFDPKGNCTMCPDNANCASVFIIPMKGYWNAHPCAPQIDRCIHEDACHDREDRLKDAPLMGVVSCGDVEDNGTAAYRRLLCKEGHEGPLCGSCAERWGASGGSDCAECQPPSVSISAITGQALLLLLLTLLEISAARGSKASSKTLNRSPVTRPKTNRSLKKISRLVLSHQGQQTGSVVQSNGASDDAQTVQLKFQETIKIGVNFLQMVAVNVSLDVSWSTSLRRLFSAWDFLGSAFTMLGSYGLDCLILYDAATPRSILREISIFLIPLVVLIVISAFWLVKWYRNRNERMPSLRLCLLTAVILFNATYVSLTRSALNAFYCVPVRDWQSDDPEAVQSYWAVDTAVRCGDPSHRLLMVVVGVPGLIFAVAFPLFLVLFLVRLKKKGLLNSEWAQETVGIFLGGYKESYLHWDALILLRKALLSAVLTFAFSLGGNLQGLLSIAVIGLSLFLQSVLRPFKEELDQLNVLDSTSLLITGFTLLAGVILDNENLTSSVVRWLLIASVLIVNVGIVGFLAVSLAKIKVELIKYELIAEDVDCGDGAFLRVACAWMQHTCARLLHRLGLNNDDLGIWEEDIKHDNQQHSLQLAQISIGGPKQ